VNAISVWKSIHSSSFVLSHLFCLYFLLPVKVVPAVSVSFLVYEQMRRILDKNTAN
jgi:hypothetical protein